LLYVVCKCDILTCHENDRPGSGKKPRICNIQDELEEKYCFIEFKWSAVCILCSGIGMLQNMTAKGIFKQMTVLLTQIILLLVNMGKNKVSDLRCETNFTLDSKKSHGKNLVMSPWSCQKERNYFKIVN
jgi:hypothetical protein